MNTVKTPPQRPGPIFFWVLAFGLCAGTNSWAQSTGNLTIEKCYELARSNYPLIRQSGLIDKTSEYSVENAAKGMLPQVTFGGQATYQSAVTKIPISLPDLRIQPPSKDQYKLFGEVNQSLTDASLIGHQKELIKANSEGEKQKIEVELYKLNERINQLYFGILLIDAQLRQSELMKKDVEAGLTKVNASIANGTALKSQADVLRAELLRADQRTIELQANRHGFADMLSFFINKPVDTQTALLVPEPYKVSSDINRPELTLFEIQKKSFGVQEKILTARNYPRLSIFMQGGFGRPALNLLSNTFDFYFLGGLRLNWNLAGLYSLRNDRQLLSLNKDALDIQKETFLFNTRLALSQQNSEINKYQALLDSDRQIIGLREEIKTTASAQLQFGTLTATDYLTYVNAEDAARQNLLLHQMQLLMSQYTYKTTTGNQ